MGLTPLHYGAAQGLDTFVHQLLDEGANPNIKDLFGYTPLHYAAINGQTETLNILITSGADVTLTNNNGATALQLATSIATRAQGTQRGIQATAAVTALQDILQKIGF